jgi:ribonucleoside-diphosphate reductase alpha chain
MEPSVVDTEVTVKSKYFSDNAIVVLCKRYFQKGDEFPECAWCGEHHETEDMFFDRICFDNTEYREMLSSLKFLPNSPTLFNLGTKSGGTLSACFKFTVDDTMFGTENGIMPVAMKAAKVLKAGGGVGYALSKIRAQGSVVHSTHGSALGPLGVLRIYHTLAKEITQGGKRDAAQMAILHCDHPDIEKFIHAKDEDPDALGTFNISVALTDKFMEAALRSPDTREYRLLKEMAESAWRTGDPGCYFIDTSNRTNPTPWLGELDGTNPCGEVPLLANEPCNLGSINLGKFWDPDIGDPIVWEELEKTVRLAIRYLDDVLDANVFPDPEIDAAARLTRKLGLGVCGFADLLTLMEIHYDTKEAVNLGKRIMGFINAVAHSESMNLAEEKGVAPCFKGRNINLRNATRTCIAPTGTIAIIMGASSGIEPYFALENTRTMGDGTTMIERPWPYERALRVVNLDVFTPKIANDIDYSWHIQHQAAFQACTDLAVSKTINMAEDATPEDVFQAYVGMWKLGCKGGTIYRNNSRANQVLKHIEEVEVIETPTSRLAWRQTLPDERPMVGHRFVIGGVKGYAQVGLFDDGEPAELFLQIARAGSTLDGMADWVAHEVSICLQMAHLHGVPFTVLTDKWIGRAFEPHGITSNPDIPFTSSIADYIARWMKLRFSNEMPIGLINSMKGEEPTLVIPDEARGDLCPDCGRMLQFSEGCAHCSACGYERC